MIKKLLFLLVCVATTVGAWGQDATFDKSTAGTLKIKASGDLTNYSMSETVKSTVFTDAAVGNIFTGTASNTGIVAGTVYNAATNYYHVGEATYGDALNSGKPADGDYTYYTVSTALSSNIPSTYYLVQADSYDGGTYYYVRFSYGTPTITSEPTLITKGRYSYVLVPISFTQSSDLNETDSDLINRGFVFLTPDNFSTYFSEGTTITPKSEANIYVSITTEGAEGDKVAKNSAFLWQDGMNIYNATLGENILIENNATYFGATGDGKDYITEKSEIVTGSFKDNLVTEIKSGNYTSVIFEQNGGDITIDKEIIYAILFGNKSTRESDSSVTTVDLGATTINSLDGIFTGNETSLVLESLTLPKLPIVDEEMILPSFLGQGYSWTTHSLRTVNVPSGYTKIGTDAFFNGNQLTTVTLPAGITEIGTYAFKGCNFTSISLPSTVEIIGNFAFEGCTNLSSTPENPFVFPSSLEKIGSGAFDNCKKFLTINLNSGLEFIGNSAFYSDSKIATQEPTLDIPSTVQYIGPGAFFYRNYADIYFHSEVAPVCPVGPSYHGETMGTYDIAAFGAETHMGNNGFNPYKTEGSTNDDAYAGYANRENYINNGGIYFTILHFPAGITIEQAKTYKDVTRRYVTALGYTGNYEDNNFYYGGSVDCGEEQTEDVKSFKDYNAPNEPWKSTGAFHKVAPGYKDTYLGEQKIWPSQNQWMRAYTTVANGVEWNGVTAYRPTVSNEMIDLMIQDGLMIWDPSTNKYLSISDENYTLNETTANLYNASLDGAVHAGDVKDYLNTQENVNAYNAELSGAVTEGTHNYTEEQANAYNAALPGAVSTATIKEPAVEAHDVVYYDWTEIVSVNGTEYIKETLTYYPAVPATYYSEDEIATANDGNTYVKETLIYHEQSIYTEEELTKMSDWEKSQLSKDDNGNYIKPAYYEKTDASKSAWIGGQKTAAIEEHYDVNENSKVKPTDNIKTPAVEAQDAVYYTQEQADEYNAKLEGHKTTEDTYTVTADEAIAYNATLPGAKKLNDPWHYYDETSANEYNADLSGAKKPDASGNYGTMDVATAFSDYLSKIAYQSTRRFVLADDGSYQTKVDDKYEIDIKGQNWWTLCLPFNMTKKEVDDVFGEGTHVCLFSGVDRDATSSSKHITLKFQNDVYAHKTEVKTTTAQTSSGGKTGSAVIRTYEENFNPANSAPTDDDIVIQAFEAYMIFPQKDNKDAAKFYVPNPRVEQGSPYPTIVEANTPTAGNTPAYASSSDHTEYRFVGNLLESYVSTDANGQQVLVTNKIPQYSYMYAKKKNDSAYKFWFNKSTTISWAIKKCVVQATAKDGGATDSSNFFGNSQNQAKETSIFGDFYDEFNSDNDVTNIEKVTIIAGEGDDAQEVYNLNGQQIYNAPAKSVYIKNGRKYIAR